MQQGSPPAGQAARGSRRLKAFLPATIEGGQPIRVHILNVSLGGALCHAVQPPACGARVVLGGEALSLEGRVVWRDGPRFGIRFVAPIAAAELERLIGG